jgi:hypothetical protein
MTKPTIVTFDSRGRAQFTRGEQVAHELLDDNFTHGDMLRVTDIVMESTSKKYMIKWLAGPHNEKLHDAAVYAYIFGKAALAYNKVWIAGNFVLLFDTYEDAVAHERDCLAEMRKQGIVFS